MLRLDPNDIRGEFSRKMLLSRFLPESEDFRLYADYEAELPTAGT